MKTKHLLLLAVLILSRPVFSQIPILNSSPAITNKVIYLDFDGQVVSGTGWNSGNTVNALPSNLSSANMFKVWQRVSEDYRPFDVNITTDSMRFRNAPPNKRMRVVITPTHTWYTNPPGGTPQSAGGVAFVGSFAWGGTPGTPCWIFETQLGNSAKNIGEACSHEAGHTLSLKHQSTYSAATCSKTAEYNPGQGNGVTSWAPIMGVGYSKNITTWYNGKSAVSCTTIQYDHSNASTGITGTPYLSFLPDDVGDTYANAKILNLTSQNLLDSGIITTPADMDAYRFSICNNRYVSFDIKPWAIDTTTYDAANLDIRFMLYNSSNSLLLVDTPLTKLQALKGMTLAPDSYYFTVDGGRSANYSDYGSLGKYYVRIKATNPPALSNTIVTSPAICLNQSTTFSLASNGTPTSWLWTVGDGSTTSTLTTQNPALTFTATGVYTISLLATSSSSASCEVTQTLGISAVPVLTVAPSISICSGTTAQIYASGASSYLWLPGNLAGGAQVVSPTVTTIYTVTGTSNLCSSSPAVVTVSVVPDFSLQVSASSTVICPGASATISVTGPSAYTVNPGGFINTPAIVSPSVSTIFFISGSNGICMKSTTKNILISAPFTINVSPSDTMVCAGQSVALTASGASSYVINPGGITSNPAVVTPSSPVTYTITGYNADNCPSDTTAEINASICTGIATHDKTNNLSIYPNPASGELTIASSADCEKVEIINTLGKLIFEKNVSSKTVQLSTENWANGVYIVRAYFSGRSSAVQKIIVQH